MRLLLALLAILGLLMTPVAASAAAAACHDHMGAAASAKATAEGHTVHAADHSCCDDDGGAPAHDGAACAKACAAMCAPAGTLAAAQLEAPSPLGRQHLEPAPARALHAHAPPGLKRPPRSLA